MIKSIFKSFETLTIGYLKSSLVFHKNSECAFYSRLQCNFIVKYQIIYNHLQLFNSPPYISHSLNITSLGIAKAIAHSAITDK